MQVIVEFIRQHVRPAASVRWLRPLWLKYLHFDAQRRPWPDTINAVYA